MLLLFLRIATSYRVISPHPHVCYLWGHIVETNQIFEHKPPPTLDSKLVCKKGGGVLSGDYGKFEFPSNMLFLLRLHDIPGMYTYALWKLRTGCNFIDSCNQDDKIIIPSILAQFQLSLFSLAMLFEWSILKVSI